MLRLNSFSTVLVNIEGSNANKKETANRKKKGENANKKKGKRKKRKENEKGLSFRKPPGLVFLIYRCNRQQRIRLIEHYFHRGLQNQVIVDFHNNRHAVHNESFKLWNDGFMTTISADVDVGDHKVRETVRLIE